MTFSHRTSALDIKQLVLTLKQLNLIFNEVYWGNISVVDRGEILAENEF